MRKSILFTMLCTLFAALSVSAAEPWQFSFSKETSTCFKNKGVYQQFISPMIELDEPTDVIRLTVFATRNTDDNTGYRAEGFSNSAPAFPTFAISEIRVYDANDNLIELFEENFETNALSLNEGALAYLADNDLNTHFHSTYSEGEAPQAYHYIDIMLPEELTKFRIEYDGRHYFYFTDPTYVALTAGTEALPWNEENFVLGEQVTDVEALQPNTFYALRGNYFEYTNEGSQRYEPSYGEAFYHSPLGAALTPSMASVFYLEDAGEGQYHMRWLKNNHYLATGVNLGGSGYAEWNDDVRNAAAITFHACDTVEGAFEIEEGNLHLGQRRFIRMSWVNDALLADEAEFTYNYAWNVYKVDFSNAAIVPVLQSSIEKAEALIAEQGNMGSHDDDISMPTALAAAKEIVVNASASAKEMFDKNVDLVAAINEYRGLYLYVLIDSLSSILYDEAVVFCDAETGWVAGGFPEEYKAKFEKYIDEATIIVDAAKSYDDIDEYIGKISETIDAFWASRVDKVTSYPLIFTEDCGLLTKQVDNIYYWTSPIYYMDSPTDVIRMTVFQNSSGETEPDYNVGTPFFCLGEFILYDESGNQIELREDMFSTNSLQTHDGSGLAGLCDGNPNSFYHGCYAPDPNNGSFAPEKASEGEYCYIEVALDEEISAFSYGFVSRQYPGDYYKHIPLYFAFTPGNVISKDEADDILDDVEDIHKVTLGAQVTAVDEIVPGEIYALFGNLNVKNGAEPTGFYNSFNSVSGSVLNSACAFTFEKDEEGGFYIRNLGADTYMKEPTHWSGVSTTYFKEESFPLTIVPSTNLENAFKLYWRGEVTDSAAAYFGEGEVYYMMQDWGSYIGMFTIDSLAKDDVDGESDWFIYRISMERSGLYELKSVSAAISDVGVDFEYVGDAVGMYSGKGVDELINAVNKAQALWDSNDDAACKAAADELQNLLQTSVPLLEMNELVSGQNYVIRSANEEFIPYHGDTKFAMYVGPTNYQDTERDNETMLWWTYEYTYGLDSTAYHFTFEKDTVRLEGDATDAGWGKYTIKNVFADQYIVPEQGAGKNLVVGEYDAASAPRIYVAPGDKPGLRRLVGADAWRTGDNIYSYFEVRTGGGGYGTGGAAHYGHVAQWYFLANTAQWKLIPVANTTSIDDLIVDEPQGEVVSVAYYTPAGVATGTPVKGVNIVKRVYANGVIETKKIYVK